MPEGRGRSCLRGPGGPIMCSRRTSRAGRRPRIPKGGWVIQGQDPLSPREEQQLVSNLLAGDDEAVREVYARFGRPIYTLGLRLLGSADAAEEPTQHLFLTAWPTAARFDAARAP